MKRSIVLLLPGLAGPFDSSWESQIDPTQFPPFFLKMIQRSKQGLSCQNNIQDALEDYLHLSKHTPWGWFGIRGEGFKVSTTDWFKLEIFNTNIRPIADKEVIIEIAKNFAQNFNYAEDAIITSSGNWYMSLGNYKQVYSTPPWMFDDINMESFGLSGNDAPIWQMRFQEAKKWLEAHPLKKELTVPLHFFWPWGNSGSTPFVGELGFSALYSNSVIFQGLGEHLGIGYGKLDDIYPNLTGVLTEYPRIFVYDDSLYYELSGEKTMVEWEAMQNQFIINYIQPLLIALENKIIDEIVVDDGLGENYVYDNKFRLRFKRRQFTYHYKQTQANP